MTAVMQIRKSLELFRSRNATISLGLTPEDANYELSKIIKSANKFSELANQIASDNKISKEDETAYQPITDAIDEGKYEILCSALSKDFSEQYKLQLRAHEKFDDLSQFLESIFQSNLTKDDKIKAARLNLAKVTRFSSENETFSNFLKRVETIGKPLKTTNNTELFDLFTAEAFNRNLTPHHKACLNDQNQCAKSLVEQAKFLDDRKKHLKAMMVNQVESSEYTDLKAQIAALTTIVQNALLKESETPEVNKISTQSDKPKLNRNWSFKNNNRPTRCQQCGLFGHSRENCRRTLKAICHKCGKQGHLQAVCRLAKNLH